MLFGHALTSRTFALEFHHIPASLRLSLDGDLGIRVQGQVRRCMMSRGSMGPRTGPRFERKRFLLGQRLGSPLPPPSSSIMRRGLSGRGTHGVSKLHPEAPLKAPLKAVPKIAQGPNTWRAQNGEIAEFERRRDWRSLLEFAKERGIRRKAFNDVNWSTVFSKLGRFRWDAKYIKRDQRFKSLLACLERDGGPLAMMKDTQVRGILTSSLRRTSIPGILGRLIDVQR